MVLGFGLILAISALACVAQTSPLSVSSGADKAAKLADEDGLRSAQRRFPPELWSTGAQSPSVQPTRSYCVYPPLESRSLAFRRCSPAKKMRLLPSMQLLPKSFAR